MRTQPLRVALISEHASPLAAAGGVDSGGQNVYVAEVARGLAEAGLSVEVLTRRDDPSLPAVVRLPSGARVVHVDAGPARFVPKEELLPYMPAFADEVLRRLEQRALPYDVLHANFFMSGWVGLALKRHTGTPLVTTFHALGLVRREHQREADRFPAERIAIERALVRHSDLTIAACPQDESDLLRLYDADAARLVRVPCGVDTTAFAAPADAAPASRSEAPCDRAASAERAAIRHALGLAPDEFVVLQLGRLVPRKGVDNVIHAVARLHAAEPQARVRLVVVGGDADTPDEQATPEIARLRGIAQDAGIAERVRFTGRRARDRLREWYVAADVFVTTPWYEPFGITPLEAMACGTPVVGSAVGGIAWTVVDGVTGYLVPPKDPDALAERLARLWRDPQRAAALGAAGAARVRAQFTWDHVADRLARSYAALARRAGAASAFVPPPSRGSVRPSALPRSPR